MAYFPLFIGIPKITPETMALNLPYVFDTTKSGRLILKGTGAILAIMSLELPYILFFEPYKLLTFVLVSAVILYLGVFFFKHLSGATGTISNLEITINPCVFWGMRSISPEGCFPLTQFRCVRVDVIPTGKRGPHDRVYLAGKDNTPDIVIARTRREEGIALGHALGSLLGLVVEERLLTS